MYKKKSSIKVSGWGVRWVQVVLEEMKNDIRKQLFVLSREKLLKRKAVKKR